jgi:hypothetical protein
MVFVAKGAGDGSRPLALGFGVTLRTRPRMNCDVGDDQQELEQTIL